MFRFLLAYIWHLIQTTVHKIKVFKNLISISRITSPKYKWALIRRGITHDLSKYRWSEAKNFAKVIFKLRSLTYGSKEYKECLDKIRPSINLHYKRNTHHPEHYEENGYDDMSRIDKLEMIADWKAATTRHEDGDILESIEINQKRFGYSNSEKNWILDIVILTSRSRP